MTTYNIEEISEYIMLNGFFSEYLPPNFNLEGSDFNIFEVDICNTNDYVEPYKYSMSRFSENDERRIISIPELTAYISVVKYMNSNNIFKELIDLSLEDEVSFSKIIQENGKLFRHENIYGLSSSSGIESLNNFSNDNSTFISNIIKKLNISKGAKGVLYLDISNFYGSIYTHILPSIILGYDEAIRCFKSSCTTNDIYNKYRDLDKQIRKLNGKRTNGLLTGPLISQIIGESLLSKIDCEIKENKIMFTRYVDDYEVYIYDHKDIEKITSTISTILNKYYFYLNNEKTKYTKFPYYKIRNLNKIINTYNHKLDEYDLMELFNTFFDLEENGTKGSIRYLVKSISEKNNTNYSNFTKNPELLTTYLLNILVNDNRSLPKVCELLIREKDNLNIDYNFKNVIEKLLISCINSKKELEVIWLLYLIKSIGIKTLEENIIKNIIKSENELAIIILLHEFDNCLNEDNKNNIKESASSWILLYQLYFKDYINKSEFKDKSGINKNINFYSRIKFKKFSFYKNI